MKYAKSNEPSHEIMVLFVLCKLILQRRMRSHPVGPDVWFLVGLFVYFHTSCLWTAKALVRLRRCAGSPEPSLVACVISTINSRAGSNKELRWLRNSTQYRSVRLAERLALPTSDHGVTGSNPAGGEILSEPKRRFIAQSLSCSPFHRLEMTEILLKGRKTLTHRSINSVYFYILEKSYSDFLLVMISICIFHISLIKHILHFKLTFHMFPAIIKPDKHKNKLQVCFASRINRLSPIKLLNNFDINSYIYFQMKLKSWMSSQVSSSYIIIHEFKKLLHVLWCQKIFPGFQAVNLNLIRR